MINQIDNVCSNNNNNSSSKHCTEKKAFRNLLVCIASIYVCLSVCLVWYVYKLFLLLLSMSISGIWQWTTTTERKQGNQYMLLVVTFIINYSWTNKFVDIWKLSEKWRQFYSLIHPVINQSICLLFHEQKKNDIVCVCVCVWKYLRHFHWA